MGAAGKADTAGNFAAAGLATLTSRLALHPLDTLRTRAQRPPGVAPVRQSFASLWAGLPASCAGSIPAQSVYYSVYAAFKPALGVLPAAAVANVVAAVIRVPAELLKQRAQSGAAPALLGSVRAILRADGPTGLWRGFSAQVARDVPYAMALFGIYEVMAARGRGRDRGMIAGAFAGTLASLATAPLDLIKTRTMLGSGSVRISARGILRAEGKAVFWRGVSYRVAYKCCSSAIFFAALEFFLGLASSSRTRRITAG